MMLSPFLSSASTLLVTLLRDLTFTDLIGILAGIFSTWAFLPQAVKVWCTHSTRDLSRGMYVLYTASLLLWGLYAWMINAWPLLFTEALTLFLSLYILVMTIGSYSGK